MASNGLVHPTSAGATGSLGVVSLVAARVLWGWPWTRVLLVPGVIASGTLLVFAHSRTGDAMTVAILSLLLVRYTGTRVVAGSVLAVSVCAALLLVVDPGLTTVDDADREFTQYIRRGESDEQMESLNGRGALWDAIWAEYEHSPLLGHGYFMTSRSGILDVWSGPDLRTAHNFCLQVLASTGIVGIALFLWGLARPVVAVARSLTGAEAPRVRAFLFLVALWYLGWGQMCESFMGPVQPESVTFYCLFGLAVAQVRAVPAARGGAVQ
jgi:O-antigen ligase